MALRASNLLPATAYDKVRRTALVVQRECQDARGKILGGSMTSDDLFQLLTRLTTLRSELVTNAATPGLAAYAAAQEDDPAYDAPAEYLALRNAIDGVISEVTSTFPADGSGYLLSHQWNGSQREPRVFLAAVLVNLGAALQTVIDAVE